MQASKRSSATFQFSARHLFYFVWLCATATALLGWLGMPVACFVLLVWVQILAGARREASEIAAEGEFVSAVSAGVASSTTPEQIASYQGTRCAVTKIELLVVLLISTLLIGLFVPAASESDPMQQAEMSMKMVAKAIAAYEQQHGSLPPLLATDEPGQPQPSSLQLLLDSERNWFVIEHEQASRPWLEPAENISWRELEELPRDDQGFWHHGFFTSSYRGRLVVSDQQTIQVHPRSDHSPPAMLPLEQRVAIAARTGAASVELGKPYRQVHWGNALRLVMFLIAVLYPLRWLSAICDRAA